MPLISVFGPSPNGSRIASPSLITGPAIEVVSLSEAKAWLKIDTTDEDGLLTALITAARLTIEAVSRRLLINQSWRLTLDSWPASISVPVQIGPVQSITALRSYDANNALTNYDVATFLLDKTSMPVRIMPVGQSVPATNRLVAGIEIDLLVGFGPAATDVPQPLRQAILLLTAHLFENRGDMGGKDGTLPPEIDALVAPYRRPRII